MTSIDPETVPATPVYTITLNANGAAAVNGQEVTGPGLDPDEARLLALGEVRVKAALHGRPVRVLAKDADGTAWPLIVATDGTVTTLDRPHPVPPPPAPQPAPPPPSSGRHPYSDADEFTVAMRRETPPAFMGHGHQTTAGQTPAPRAAETNAWGHPVPEEWNSPLPEEYRAPWEQLATHQRAGALAEAIVTAYQLETDLTKQFGPLHPHTVNVLTVRAWLTLASTAHTHEWAETTELLVETAQRQRDAMAPQEESARVLRNAHGAWRLLRDQDAESAREIAEPLLNLLVAFPSPSHAEANARRARDIIHWIESGAAA
ncbi:hypothetical protein QQY66_48890 [Streptomyces sp. DG2A-72]|uniref:hypothetical protein n=1 Tax=Streptomyces sp. DG2A-72 TaxID=3051386 RepID=UPI00265C36A2|nr:hypothetical protein [Streptomyces sp. DG2A-72]MDO0939230.1 hypothetical protein [Streptomyces sp. DG2A-72]